MDGIDDLKSAIVNKFKLENKINYLSKNITVGVGGKHVIYNLFMTSLDSDDEVIVEDKTAELEKPKTRKKKEGKQFNFFKLLLVFIISFVAFVLIVDTFIVQISVYIPFAEKYLDNLYQSIIDISLFFQNLIK